MAAQRPWDRGRRPRTASRRWSSGAEAQWVRTCTSWEADTVPGGVLLYELLTGHRPYERSRAAAADAERAILTREPTAPSSALVPRKYASDQLAPTVAEAEQAAGARGADRRRLRARLRGDLDTIVLMALRKEPERRYATVAALLDDIERHITGRPVVARPNTWHYRSRKLVARRPGAAAAVIAVLLATGGYTLTLRAHATRLEQERNLARTERERAERALSTAQIEAAKAEQVASFLTSLFDASNPRAERTDTLSARVLLARGTERIRQQLHGQPEVRAALLAAIGQIHTKIGLFDQAEPILEESLSLRRELHPTTGADVAESLELLADNHARNRGFVRAETPYREALAIRRQQPGGDPLALANTLLGLARTLTQLGKSDSAEIFIREALALRSDVLGDAHPDVTAALSTLATILRSMNKLDEAASLYREVLAKQRAQPGTDPLVFASTQNDVAYFHSLRREYADAELLYREALTTYRAILGDAHRTTAVAATNLVGALFDQGKLAEAEVLLRERIEIERRHQTANHWRIGAALGGLAAFYTERQDHSAAEPILREQIAVYTAGLGPAHDWTLTTQAKLGLCLAFQQRFAEAEKLLIAALAAAGQPEEPAKLAEARAQVQAALAQVYEAWGRPEKAASYRAATVPRTE